MNAFDATRGALLKALDSLTKYNENHGEGGRFSSGGGSDSMNSDHMQAANDHIDTALRLQRGSSDYPSAIAAHLQAAQMHMQSAMTGQGSTAAWEQTRAANFISPASGQVSIKG